MMVLKAMPATMIITFCVLSSIVASDLVEQAQMERDSAERDGQDHADTEEKSVYDL
jgi:hypothetical protein